MKIAIALVALAAAVPAPAQLYKWSDERGRITYSDRKPSDPKVADRLEAVSNQVSVYSPDQGLMQATRQRRVEPEPGNEPGRVLPQYAAAMGPQAPAGFDSCRGIDCVQSGPSYSYPASFFVPFHRQQPLVQAVLPPGAIAGTITSQNGQNGTIPGNTVVNGMIPGNTAGLNGTIPGTFNTVPRARVSGAHYFRER